MSWVIIEIKIKKLDGDYNYFNLIYLKNIGVFFSSENL